MTEKNATKTNANAMTLIGKTLKVSYDNYEGSDDKGVDQVKKYCPAYEVHIPNTLLRYEGDILSLFKSGIANDHLITKLVKRAHFEARRGWWDAEAQCRRDAMNGTPLRDLINMFGLKDCPALLKPLKNKIKRFLKEVCLVEVKDDGTVTIKAETPDLFERINSPTLTVMTYKPVSVPKDKKTPYQKVDELLSKLAASKAVTEDATAMAYINAMLKASTDWLEAAKQLDGKAE